MEETILKIKERFSKHLIIQDGKYLFRIKCGSCPERYDVVQGLMELGVKRIGINHYFQTVTIDFNNDKKSPALWGYDQDGKVMG